MWRRELNLSGPEQAPVVSFCKHGYELMQILDQLATISFLKRTLLHGRHYLVQIFQL